MRVFADSILNCVAKIKSVLERVENPGKLPAHHFPECFQNSFYVLHTHQNLVMYCEGLKTISLVCMYLNLISSVI